jgi:polysaccharide chain length determinant protein (PEP-CTERM system associated)
MERTLKQLADRIYMDGGGEEHIYAISYADKEPQRAMRVVEELLKLFVQGAIGETHLDTTSTQQFLNEQISDYEAKLEAAENNLKEFKRNNMGLMPEAGQTYFSQMSLAIDQLNTTQLELEEAINRRNELKKQIKGIKVSGDIPSGPTISPLQDRLDKLLMQYTEKHPEVIAMQELIENQEGQFVIEPDIKLNEYKPSLRLQQNFAYQEFMVALGKTEAEVAALRVRLKKYEGKVAQLQKMIETMPHVEAELAKLNRDYSIIKDNYEEMVRRREAAKITYEAEQSTNDVQFKIIDAPRVPMLPVGPRRLLLLTATLVFGFGAGIGLALFLIKIKPTFYNWQDLQEAIALPVFGAVSIADTSNRRVKMVFQAVSFWSLFLLFILVFATLATLRVLHIAPTDVINTLKGNGLL